VPAQHGSQARKHRPHPAATQEPHGLEPRGSNAPGQTAIGFHGGHGERKGTPRSPDIASDRVLREIAEYPNSFGPLAQGDERIEDRPLHALRTAPGRPGTTVQRQRFPLEQVDEVLAEVRDALRAPRTNPDAVGDRQLGAPGTRRRAARNAGLVPDKDPYAVALVLTTGAARDFSSLHCAPGRDPRRARSFRPGFRGGLRCDGPKKSRKPSASSRAIP
jgi:hypothetical protein